VLFVDDEPAVHRSIVRALRGTRLEVLAADCARDALGIMREHHVDVLVSDIDMPGMNGLELMKHARGEFPATLRVLLTGNATLPRTMEAINDGEVCRFLAKPFERDGLLDALGALAAKIQEQRRGGEAEAHATRRRELEAWAEAMFPGCLAIARNGAAEVIVDPPPEHVALLDRDCYPRLVPGEGSIPPASGGRHPLGGSTPSTRPTDAPVQRSERPA
jgi:DNA-binding NtrC family response regulator